MKKAKDWMNTNNFINGFSIHSSTVKIEEDFITLIKQVQIDAIDAAVKMCAESALVTAPGGMYRTYTVNEKSILRVADKLKKEIENEN